MLNVREVSKDYMIHLIKTESPVFSGLDENGLMHLTGSGFSFVYTPFGKVVAENSETGIRYGCYAHEFSLMYEGICAERSCLQANMLLS